MLLSEKPAIMNPSGLFILAGPLPFFSQSCPPAAGQPGHFCSIKRPGGLAEDICKRTESGGRPTKSRS